MVDDGNMFEFLCTECEPSTLISEEDNYESHLNRHSLLNLMLFPTIEMWVNVCKHDHMLTRILPSKLRKPDVYMEIIKNDYLLLLYVPDHIKTYKFMSEIAKINSNAIGYIPKSFIFRYGDHEKLWWKYAREYNYLINFHIKMIKQLNKIKHKILFIKN